MQSRRVLLEGFKLYLASSFSQPLGKAYRLTNVQRHEVATAVMTGREIASYLNLGNVKDVKVC